MHALLQEVSRDFLLREELVTDPTTLVAEYTRKEKIEPVTAEATNRLIYSVVSSSRILQALKTAFTQRKVDQSQFVAHLSQAAAAAGDQCTVFALARSSWHQVPLRYDIVYELLVTLLTTSQSSEGTSELTATGPVTVTAGTSTETGTTTSTQTETGTETETGTQPQTETQTSTQTQTGTQTETETQTSTEPATLTFTQTWLPETELTGGTFTNFTAPLTEPTTSQTTIFTNATFEGPFTDGVIDEGFERVLRGGDRLVYLGTLSALVRYGLQLRAAGALTS
jgi:hypothetical protein